MRIFTGGESQALLDCLLIVPSGCGFGKSDSVKQVYLFISFCACRRNGIPTSSGYCIAGSNLTSAEGTPTLRGLLRGNELFCVFRICVTSNRNGMNILFALPMSLPFSQMLAAEGTPTLRGLLRDMVSRPSKTPNLRGRS